MSADPGSSDQAPEADAPQSPDNIQEAGNLQRLVEIRCGFAEMARNEANAASARAAETKSLLDAQAVTVAQAQAQVDPAATHAAKDEAHRTFRAAVVAARERGQVEAAAGSWLAEINRINSQSRILQARLTHEREVAEALVTQLARLSSTSEASTAAAEKAIEACREAQAEAAASPASASQATLVAPATAIATAITSTIDADADHPATDWLVVDIKAREPQAIIRLVRHEGKTLTMLVDRLAGRDVTARSCWGLLLSTFVDAVAAAAIEDACLVFPQDDPFWSQFELEQSREIARGLAALGFRYDGFGSFADGRVPGHRDLAMAVGSAGMLPARVHFWPKPEQAGQLLKGVTASADTFIASKAPALTLGELVRLLGYRADLLADLWNDWPRVRPLLFSTNLEAL